MPEPGSVSRRTFLERGATAAAVTLVSRHVLGGPRHVPPSDRINVGLRRLRHPGPAPAHPRPAAERPAHHRRLRPQPPERGLRRVVPLRAAQQGPRLPEGPRVGRGGEGLPLRARGGPRDRGPALRRGDGRRVPRLRRLPGDAARRRRTRRRLHHDPGPPPRHDRPRGDAGRQARDRPQAARQRPARGAARRRGGAGDGRGHAHVLRRGPGGRRRIAEWVRPARSAPCARCTTGPRGPSGRRA
jgi:hypothetical protein